MSENRESFITVKSADFKESDAKCRLNFRFDCGTAQCTERLNAIKELGVEVPNDCGVITHDFETEEDAAKLANVVNGLKTSQNPQFQEKLKLLETAKAIGKRFVAVWRADPDFIHDMKIMPEFTSTIGDLAHTNQWLEVTFADTLSLKEMIAEKTVSPLANALSGFCLNAKLSVSKEMPLKVVDFIMSKEHIDESEGMRLKLTARVLAAFHHLNLEVDLRSPSEQMKLIYKNEIFMAATSLAQMLVSMVGGFGLMEVARRGSADTKLRFCVTPLLSFEINLHAPTAVESLEKLSSSETISP